MKKLSSTSYSKQLKILHDEKKGFGKGDVTSKHYKVIESVITANKYSSILDYGCGKGNFVSYLRQKYPDLEVTGFDIASDEFTILPSKEFDLTVSLDVLEHVEFGSMSNVLSEIRERTKGVFICSIANYPAAKLLPDGRNAHITQLPFASWFGALSVFFRVDKFTRTGKAEGLFFCTRLTSASDWR
jgi:2-polyprenyl-3-methyl-5-hydroxy-6-metoxy-1,4-benzoquinol methylase